jgi:hypothetical protein
MIQPEIITTLESIESRTDHWLATVHLRVPDDAVPDRWHIPSALIVVPIDPLGKSFEQVQQEAIQLAQGCIQAEALWALARPR